MSSVSIIIPSYREVNNLRPAFESVIQAVHKAGIRDYEVILAVSYRPDGTHDGTPILARTLASENPGIVSAVIDDGKYAEIGCRYHQGVRVASKEYVAWVPGDNETEEGSLAEILKCVGEADVVVVYTANPEVRTASRRLVSKGFVTLCNFLFGLHLRYYNGLCIIRRSLVERIPAPTGSFAFMAETLIYLMRSGATYRETPMRIKPITNVSSSFKLRSVFQCSVLLARLFWRINIRNHRLAMPGRSGSPPR